MVGTTLTLFSAPAGASAPVSTQSVIQVQAVGQDQCGKPVLSRIGPWACLEPSEPSTGPTTAAAATSSQRCDGSGCWTYVNYFTANYHGTFKYGANGIAIGVANFQTEDIYSGGGLTTTITWSTDPSTRVSDLRLMVQRLDTSGTSAGTAITPMQTTYCGAKASCQVRSMSVRYNNGSVEQSTWHEANWWLSGFPGHFWVYAKSLEAYRDSTGGYRFYGQMYVVPNSQGSGWAK